MPRPRRLTISLLLVPALVASACGSSKPSTTGTAASVSVSTPSTPGTGTQASTPAKTSTQSAAPTGPVHSGTTANKTTTSPPKVKTTPPRKTTSPRKPKVSGPEPTAAAGPPFPPEITVPFLTVWLASHQSKASGECVIAKYKARNIERGEAIAELVGIEVLIRSHLGGTRRVRQSKLGQRAEADAAACHGTIP